MVLLMDRQIVHLHVISFAVAVARVRDPSLRKWPVVVASGRSQRALVLERSQEARRDGVRRGMLLERALSFCPHLKVQRDDARLRQRAAAALGDIVRCHTPVVESRSNGRLFADLTGTTRLFGRAQDTARRIQKETASRLGLPANIGLATNKLVSSVAARIAPPEGLADVRPGSEPSFLSPLPVRFLPAVRPHREGRLLADLNVRRISELAALPFSRLLLAFHERAYALHQQARGVDNSPVCPPESRPHIHTQETLPRDTNDDGMLKAFLLLLVERAGHRLRARGLEAGAARLEVRLADGHTVVRGRRLQPIPHDDRDLFTQTEPLLEKVFLHHRIRIRWIGLTLTDLMPAARQLALFGKNGHPARAATLAAALDRLRARYGESAVGRLTSSGIKHPAPFLPGSGE